MPQAEAVTDWRHEVRTLVLAGLGARESARKLGLSVDMVRKFVQREGLCRQREQAVAIIRESSPLVATAGQVLADDAERLGPEARHIAARIGHKALVFVDNTMTADPEAGLVQLDSALTAGKLMQAGNVPGWERQGGDQTKVAISIFSAEQPRPLEIPATVMLPGTGDPCPSKDQA